MTGESVTGGQKRPKNPRGLDSVDRRLLQLLMRNGRMSNSRLAQGANVAESTAHTRVAAMVETGVIRGFRTEVDLAAVGCPIQAMILVRLQDSARPRLREEAHRLSTCAGVLEVFFLAGQYDLAVRVAAANTSDLRDFVVNELSRQPGTAGTETCLILEDVRGEDPPLGA
ncbi:MAG TPA: Lrp/AsnC family transcriptional regulator [Propionicimonas sp.]